MREYGQTRVGAAKVRSYTDDLSKRQINAVSQMAAMVITMRARMGIARGRAARPLKDPPAESYASWSKLRSAAFRGPI